MNTEGKSIAKLHMAEQHSIARSMSSLFMMFDSIIIDRSFDCTIDLFNCFFLHRPKYFSIQAASIFILINQSELRISNN